MAHFLKKQKELKNISLEDGTNAQMVRVSKLMQHTYNWINKCLSFTSAILLQFEYTTGYKVLTSSVPKWQKPSGKQIRYVLFLDETSRASFAANKQCPTPSEQTWFGIGWNMIPYQQWPRGWRFEIESIFNSIPSLWLLWNDLN